MVDRAQMIEQARMLVSRLERISVDSIWARRSSGARGALLKWVERFDHDKTGAALTENDWKELDTLLQAGFIYLARAAQERRKK